MNKICWQQQMFSFLLPVQHSSETKNQADNSSYAFGQKELASYFSFPLKSWWFKTALSSSMLIFFRLYWVYILSPLEISLPSTFYCGKEAREAWFVRYLYEIQRFRMGI